MYLLLLSHHQSLTLALSCNTFSFLIILKSDTNTKTKIYDGEYANVANRVTNSVDITTNEATYNYISTDADISTHTRLVVVSPRISWTITYRDAWYRKTHAE